MYTAVLTALAGGATSAVLLTLSLRWVTQRLSGGALQRIFRKSHRDDTESAGKWWHQRWLNRWRRKKRKEALDRAVVGWVDLLYVAASSGMNLHQAMQRTGNLTEPALNDLLDSVRSTPHDGKSFVEVLLLSLEREGGTACRQVAHLLRDCMQQGLPVKRALLQLQNDLTAQRRHNTKVRVRTLSLRLVVGTVFFLFPPAFVIIIFPNVLTFLGW